MKTYAEKPRPIRLKISSSRAVELYRKMYEIKSSYIYLCIRGEYVSCESSLNDALGNGRSCISINLSLLTEKELDYFEENEANFILKPEATCILVVQKETYPGIYYIGEC